MPDVLISLVRGIVPMIVGWLLSIPLVVRIEDLLGVPASDRDAWLSRGLTTLLMALYLLAARFLEQHKASFGWLLGIAKQPQYVAVMNDIAAGHAALVPEGDGPTVTDSTSPAN